VKESFTSQLKSFILPFTVLLIIPGAILWPSGFGIGWGLGLPWDMVVELAGAAILGTGLYLLVLCIKLFIDIGRGTLAPWSPTKKLVVTGPYRYTRNPMISAVSLALLGEAIVFGSTGIFIELILFLAINHIYFILSEEPGLEKRFGESYRIYKKNVPRWIPRLRPWAGEDQVK
jgi:protein-S-isoprenylcysteine O-methyltransferase Ste14